MANFTLHGHSRTRKDFENALFSIYILLNTLCSGSWVSATDHFRQPFKASNKMSERQLKKGGPPFLHL